VAGRTGGEEEDGSPPPIAPPILGQIRHLLRRVVHYMQMDSALSLARYWHPLRATREDRLGGKLTHPLSLIHSQSQYLAIVKADSIYI